MIQLKIKGNDILKSLSPEEYKEVIQIVEQCILSTDLEQYFRSILFNRFYFKQNKILKLCLIVEKRINLRKW